MERLSNIATALRSESVILPEKFTYQGETTEDSVVFRTEERYSLSEYYSYIHRETDGEDGTLYRTTYAFVAVEGGVDYLYVAAEFNTTDYETMIGRSRTYTKTETDRSVFALLYGSGYNSSLLSLPGELYTALEGSEDGRFYLDGNNLLIEGINASIGEETYLGVRFNGYLVSEVTKDDEVGRYSHGLAEITVPQIDSTWVLQEI